MTISAYKFVINDRLHFRAEYNSNSLLNEVNFYSTLNDNQELKFGIQPSKISFQGKQWKVNQLDERTSYLRVSSNGLQLDSTVFSNMNLPYIFRLTNKNHSEFQAIFENIDLSDIILPKPKRDVSGITNGTLDITLDNDKFGGEANSQRLTHYHLMTFFGDASIVLDLFKMPIAIIQHSR